ncbi:Triose-phosphate Transporter [Orbilia javanica]|uniref:Triose-phosphate Transporter n=1 Tax=Orbilia javanica TaxID=47235 RepID=A0AAN8MWJ9_9PEZI
MPELQEGENSVPLPPPAAVADTGGPTTSISNEPHQHSSLSDGIQGESSATAASTAKDSSDAGANTASTLRFPPPPDLSSPASSSRSEMPTHTQPEKNSRRRSRGQSISTSFSPVGTNNSISPTGTPTDKVSPTTRARSVSQSIQQSTPDQPGSKEEEPSKPKDSLELSTLSSGDSDEEAGLTESARDRRRKKKQRRRGLGGLSSDGNRMRDVHASSSATNNNHHHYHATDEELSHGTIINGIAVTDAEKRAADQNVIKNLAINCLLIGLWYIFSLCISVYNKWMFSEKHLNFRFPLFVTSFHMLVQFSLSSLVMWYFVQFRPGYVDPKEKKKIERIRSSSSSSNASPTRDGGRGGDEESRPLNAGDESDSDEDVEDTRVLANETQEPGPKKPIMTKIFYATRIAPCGMATGLDIGLGNMSLKYISLAFYTMCKSSSLAFVLIFAFIFRLEKPTVKLISVISVMTIGVIMMVADEAAFVLIGFILVMLASILSGLRWSLTQLLLLRNPATSNPFSSIFFLAPVMFVSLLVIAVPVEGLGKFWGRWMELIGEWGIFPGIGMLIAPGVVAFCMTASEFALLRRTSVVTLSICGIFKEVVTITASTTIFHDVLTPVNITGLLVTILSIGGYNYIKIKKMRGEAVRGVLATEADDAEGRRSLLFERRSLALNRASLESGRA